MEDGDPPLLEDAGEGSKETQGVQKKGEGSPRLEGKTSVIEEVHGDASACQFPLHRPSHRGADDARRKSSTVDGGSEVHHMFLGPAAAEPGENVGYPDGKRNGFGFLHHMVRRKCP